MSTEAVDRSDRLERAKADAAALAERQPLRAGVLERLARQPGTPKELTRDLDAASESVSRALAKLRGDGLVAATIPPSDGRIRLYRLTEKGEMELRRQRAFTEQPAPPEPRDAEDDRRFRQESLRQAIGLRRRQNELAKSNQRMLSILRRAEETGDHALALDTLSELVTTLDQDERREEAENLLAAIKVISRGMHTGYDARQALPAAAHYHYALGRLATDQSLRERASYLNTAIRLYGELLEDPPYESAVGWRERRAWANFGMAQNLHGQSFFAASLRLAVGTLEEFSDIDSSYGRAQCLYLIGFCLRLLGRFEDALSWLGDAHEVASEGGFERLLADVQLQRGEVHRCRDERDLSRQCLVEASERSQHLKLAVVDAFCHSALGALSYREELWGEAAVAFTKAHECFSCTKHIEGSALNARRQATLARRTAESERSGDLSAAEGLIEYAIGTYKTLRSPAGLLACEVERGWVQLLRKRGIDSTLKTLTCGLEDSETRLLLELDPWVPTVLNTFALFVEDSDLVERSTRLLAASGSRLDELALPAKRPDLAPAVLADVVPSVMGKEIAEMGGEARQEVEDGTEVLALSPSDFFGDGIVAEGVS